MTVNFECIYSAIVVVVAAFFVCDTSIVVRWFPFCCTSTTPCCPCHNVAASWLFIFEQFISMFQANHCTPVAHPAVTASVATS